MADLSRLPVLGLGQAGIKAHPVQVQDSEGFKQSKDGGQGSWWAITRKCHQEAAVVQMPPRTFPGLYPTPKCALGMQNTGAPQLE